MKPRLLLIDDEHDIITLLELLLGDCAELTAAESAAQARAALAAQAYDAVVSDIRLPDGDGLALVQEHAGRIPPARWVIISGYAQDEYAQCCRELGTAAFVTKPFRSLAELKKTVLATVTA